MQRMEFKFGSFLLFLVILHFPKIFHNFVHRSPVGEFHLKGHSLAGHFDVDKNVKKSWNNFQSKERKTVSVNYNVVQSIVAFGIFSGYLNQPKSEISS